MVGKIIIRTASPPDLVSLPPSHLFVNIMVAGSRDATLPASALVPLTWAPITIPLIPGGLASMLPLLKRLSGSH